MRQNIIVLCKKNRKPVLVGQFTVRPKYKNIHRFSLNGQYKHEPVSYRHWHKVAEQINISEKYRLTVTDFYQIVRSTY